MKKLICILLFSLFAFGQTGTERSRSTLYNYFSDGQSARAIVPSRVRDLIASVPLGGSTLTTTGAVPFVSSSGTLGQDGSNFVWDNVNKRLALSSVNLPVTSFLSLYGIVYKENARFLHTFNYGNNSTVTTEGGNTFLGVNSGNFTMGGTATLAYHASYNTGVGFNAFQLNTTGSHNTSIGVNSLRENTTGAYNTGVGFNSLPYNTTGYNNVGLGMAGYNPSNNISQYRVITDDNLTLLGYGATKNNDSSISNSTAIGAGAMVTKSNQVVLGNESVTETLLSAPKLRSVPETACTADSAGLYTFVANGPGIADTLRICKKTDTDTYEWGSLGSGTGGGGTTVVTSVSALRYSFTSQSSITITHNLNSLSQVIGCYNASGQKVNPSGISIGLNSSDVTFSGSTTGSCVILGGSGFYSQAFTGQTTVNLTHNLNTVGIVVGCYDTSNNLVEPNTITISSENAAAVNFLTAQSGKCVVGGSLAVTSGGGGGGTGSVTSVGITAPLEFIVSNSPVIETGNLGLSWAQQLAGMVLAAPPGASGIFAARQIEAAHVATSAKTGNGTRFLTAPSTPLVDGCLAALSGNVVSSGAPCPTSGGGGATLIAGDGIDSGQLSQNIISVDSTVPAIAVSGVQSLTFGSISQSGCGVQNITAVGASIGDRVSPGFPATLPDGIIGMMNVTATNTISVRLCKITSGAAEVTGLTFTYSVIRAR